MDNKWAIPILGQMLSALLLVFGYGGPRCAWLTRLDIAVALFCFVLTGVWLFKGGVLPGQSSPYLYLAFVVWGSGVLMIATYSSVYAWVSRLPKHLAFLVEVTSQTSILRYHSRLTAWAGNACLLMHLLRSPDSAISLAAIGGGVLIFPVWLATRKLMQQSVQRHRCVDGSCPFASLSTGSTFDVFVSYRSLDSNVVREIVDGLIAHGCKPWFAEYMIRFSGRDLFDAAIIQGIRNSRYAVLFTTDAYLNSTHCCDELKNTLSQLGADLTQLASIEHRILEIPLETDCKSRTRFSSELEIVPLLKFTTVNEVIDKILQQFQLRTRQRHLPSDAGWAASEHCIPLQESIDDGICTVRLPLADLQNPHAVHFRLRTLSDFDTISRVRLGDSKAQCLQLFKNALATSEAAKEDRWLGDNLRDTIMIETAILGAECFGVHLLWFQNRPQLVATMWSQDQWVRRYLIMLTPRGPLLDFAFGLNGSFASYCTLAHQMDHVMANLVWEPQRSRSRVPELTTAISFTPDLSASRPLVFDPVKGDNVELLMNEAFAIVQQLQRNDPEQSEKLVQALGLLTRASGLRPNDAGIWYQMSSIQARLRLWSEADRSIRLAVECEPDNDEYRIAQLETWLESHFDREFCVGPGVPSISSIKERIDKFALQNPDSPALYGLRAKIAAKLNWTQQSVWEQCLSEMAAASRRVWTTTGIPAGSTEDVLGLNILGYSLECLHLASMAAIEDIRVRKHGSSSLLSPE
ncbi:MAG: toll/interleukin-1 receptor domain-containing protein [Planctomycetaceae bacterium]|nr:toll/interleukin-1 receptor domain-containing protein [Planctomycetaceae bacterium]